MKTRDELHTILCDILGSNHCYFSPPSNIRMQYPCIIYEPDGILTRHADDKRYFNKRRYTVTVIDECADSPIISRLFFRDEFLYLSHDRTFISGSMYHYVYTLYY